MRPAKAAPRGRNPAAPAPNSGALLTAPPESLRMTRAPLFCSLFLLAAFLGMHGASAQGAPAPPKLRLDDTARPTSYEVELTVLPDRDTFSGTVSIALEL